MTDQELYRVPPARHATADSLRTLMLILATVLVGFAVVASVPDRVWNELDSQRTDDIPEWHGNVSTQRLHD